MSAGDDRKKKRQLGKGAVGKKSSRQAGPKRAAQATKKPAGKGPPNPAGAAPPTQAAPSTKGTRQAVSIGGRRGIRGAKDGWFSLVVHAPGGTGDADALLEAMLEAGWIGAARRNVTVDLLAGKVRRPMGSWGLIVQLKGQPWLYLVDNFLHYDWARELARKLNRRAAMFEDSGTHGTLYARAYEGDQTLFEFECGGLIDPAGAREVVELPGELFAMTIGGALHEPAWMRRFKSGAQVQDALAREIEAYLPELGSWSKNGFATLVGGDRASFKPADYARIDLITYGDASTLEAPESSFELARAVNAGDAAGIRAALSLGADLRYLPESDDSPLEKALGLGKGGIYDWLYKRISREQQLDVLAALLEGGADARPKDAEPPIHLAIAHNDKGDQRTVVRLVRLLLDHGADPNAIGTFMRSARQRPLHVVAVHHGWLAVMKLLVSRGANPTLPNGGGRTPRQSAEARLGQRRESLAKAGPAGLVGMIGNLIEKGAGKDAAKAKAALQSAMGGPLGEAVREATKEQDEEVRQLEESIAFLAAAERGEADTSDIDELAEASWDAWIRNHEQWKARRKAEAPERWRQLHGDD